MVDIDWAIKRISLICALFSIIYILFPNYFRKLSWELELKKYRIKKFFKRMKKHGISGTKKCELQNDTQNNEQPKENEEEEEEECNKAEESNKTDDDEERYEEEDFNELENQLMELSYFKESIYNLSERNFEETLNLIPKYSNRMVRFTIYNACKIRIFKYKLYSQLLSHVGYSMYDLLYSCYFARYQRLIHYKDTDPRKHFDEILRFEEPFEPNSIEYYIYQDDVLNFNSTISLILETTHLDTIQYINQKKEIEVNSKTFQNLLALISYCGSFNIFKYLLINKTSKHTIEELVDIHYLICSGSENCILFFADQNINFNNTLKTAVHNHHNSIAKWLYEHYEHDEFSLPWCCEYDNTEMVLYLIQTGKFYINDIDYHLKYISMRTCLHWSALQNNIPLTKYLILKGCDSRIKDIYSLTPFDLSSTEEMKNLIKNTPNKYKNIPKTYRKKTYCLWAY